MLDNVNLDAALQQKAQPKFRAAFPSGYHVQQFRFVPESYLETVGKEWDPGLDQLVYLRMFIEEETEEAFQ